MLGEQATVRLEDGLLLCTIIHEKESFTTENTEYTEH